jgi:photosystem II stability/assembly factor-like uncharacterized protein
MQVILKTKAMRKFLGSAMQNIFAFTLILFFSLFIEKVSGQMRRIFLDADQDNSIKKISFYNPAQGYVAFEKWIGYTSDSAHTFTKKYITLANVNYNGYSVNLTFGFGVNGVKAFDQNTILVYGHYGLVPAILSSVDGGNTFKLIYHSQYNPLQFHTGITDMIFPENGAVGYAVDADRILKTTNQGQTWSVSAVSPLQYFDKLEAVDNNFVFAISTDFYTGVIFKTNNAGAGWQTVTLPFVPGGGHITAAYPLTASTAWLNLKDNNNKYYIYKTTNGEASWILQNNIDATSFGTDKMKFTDNNVGYALVGQNEVYKTTNSGAIWEPIPRDNNYTYLGYTSNDFQLLGNQLWAGGGHGFMQLNTNLSGPTLPKAFFSIDTVGVAATGTVHLNNFSTPTYQFKWYVNNVQISTAYNSSYQHAIVSQTDSIKLVVTSGTYSDSLLLYQYFTVPVLPIPTSFSPSTGSTGTAITINGRGFNLVTAVQFGNVPAQSFTILSPSQIVAIVGTGASGPVSLTCNYGNFSIPGFTYFAATGALPPVITSFTPESGPPGTTVIILGSNFNVQPDNNIVFFGAVKAMVQSASSTQVTCVVPTGGNLSNLNLLNVSTGLQASAANPFHITFADSSNFTNRSFLPAFDFSLSNSEHPKYVKGKDVDGDGLPDLIMSATRYCDSVFIFRNTTSSNNFSFAARVNIGLMGCSAGTGYFTADDLDGDGKPDVVVATNDPNIKVFKNNSIPGLVNFETPITLTLTASGTQDVVIKDFDNDGKPDIAVATYNNSLLTLIRNTSTPGFLSFGAPVYYQAGLSVKLASGDFNGDGKIDIATLNYTGSGSTISWFKNIGTPGAISFSPKTDIPATQSDLNGHMIEIFDYDNDGKPDIIVINDHDMSVYRNTGSGTAISFAMPITNTFTSWIQGGSVGDLSGDSKPDFFAGASGFRQFELLQNISFSGNVANNMPIIISPQTMNIVPYNMDAADYNMDGKPDLVASGSNDHNVVIYKNNIGAIISKSLCAGQSVSLAAEITGAAYQWQMNSGSGYVNISNGTPFSGALTATLAISNTPITMAGYKFRCMSGINYSPVYQLQINGPLNPPLVVISTTQQNTCYGSTVSFTAVATNGGATPTYQWQKNGINVGTNNAVYTSNTLQNNDQIRVIMISSDAFCSGFPRDTSNVITMSVQGGPATVSVTGPSTSICSGNIATFTAAPANGGNNPSYQWQVNNANAGVNSSTFTTASLANGDQVKVIMTTAPNPCGATATVTSNTVIGLITANATPSVSILPSTTISCQGAPVTFTATPVNGGSSPTYQWLVNGINAGANNAVFTTTALINSDQVSCVLTSNASCVTAANAVSNLVVMNINSAVSPAVAITSSAIAVCAGTAVTFTAAASGGGNVPAYQWQVNGVNAGTNSAIFTSNTLSNNDAVKVILTSNLVCALPAATTSNIINIAVAAVPVANAGPDVSICAGNTTQLQGSGGNSYIWSPPTGLSNTAISNPIASPSVSTTYTLTISNGVCSAADIVAINVMQPTTPSVSITTPSVNVCDGNTVAFTANAANAGANPIYQWQVNGVNTGTNSSIFSSSQLQDNDQVKVTIISQSACAPSGAVTSNIITVSVTSLAIPLISLNSGVFTVTNADGAAGYTWQVLSGSQWGNVTPAATGITYTPVVPGSYRVKGEKQLCTVYSTLQSSSFNSNAPDSSLIFIYLHPNPTRGLITVDRISIAQHWQTLEIINSEGQNVIPGQNIINRSSIDINTGRLPAGLYFIKLVRSDGRKKYLKFIKEL